MSEKINQEQQSTENNITDINQDTQITNSNESVDTTTSNHPTERYEDEINSIELVGTVISTPVYSHEYNDHSFYSLLLRVVKSYNKMKYDDIHIFVDKEDIINNNSVVDIDTRLSIKGYIVQSKLHNYFDSSVVALSTQVVDESVKDKNHLKLSGTILRLFDNYKINKTNYVVKSFILKQFTDPLNKKYLTVKLSAWNTTVHYMDKEFKEGDHVITVGQLISKTVKKPDSEDQKDYKIVLHEGSISVIEHQERRLIKK